MNWDIEKERKVKKNREINIRPKQQNRMHGSL